MADAGLKIRRQNWTIPNLVRTFQALITSTLPLSVWRHAPFILQFSFFLILLISLCLYFSGYTAVMAFHATVKVRTRHLLPILLIDED